MTPELKRALGDLGVDRPEGLTLVPTSTRRLTDALQILASQHAALHRDVQLSLSELTQIGRVEPRGATVNAGVGVKLAALETALASQGLSLGPLSPRARTLTLG